MPQPTDGKIVSLSARTSATRYIVEWNRTPTDGSSWAAGVGMGDNTGRGLGWEDEVSALKI